MKLVTTEKKCPKCGSALDIVLEAPYFPSAARKGRAKKVAVLEATGFVCDFCDSKWTLIEILFTPDDDAA